MRCPITYEELLPGEIKYSKKGLSKLSRNLKELRDLPYTREEQLKEAQRMASKLSIQGVQPKFSAILDTVNSIFKLTEKGGTFIIKPQNDLYPNLPENEDLTMHLAETIGLEVPLHGLVYCRDGSLSYWIRRFDRPSVKSPQKNILALEDFAQLAGESRDTKYDSSMEPVSAIVDKFCSFPLIEKEKLFSLTLFSFLVGNEDMHLKNFSLINRKGLITLAPAYDLINSTVALMNAHALKDIDELALPIRGKRRKLTRADFIDYFGIERLRLSAKRIDEIVHKVVERSLNWEDLIQKSFLPKEMKEKYISILTARQRIFD